MPTEGGDSQEYTGLRAYLKSVLFLTFLLLGGQAENFSPGSTLISLSDRLFLKLDN